MPKKNKCFVICPFGAVGSDVRKHSDTLVKYILKPVTEDAGYKMTFRTIDDAVPGSITQQIIQELYDADLVIADLSGSNPNVFYELALRHCVGKPVIHLSDDPGKVPFDIANMSVIQKRLEIGDDLENFKKELSGQIAKINEGFVNFENPAYTNHPLQRVSPGTHEEYISKWFEWKLEYSKSTPEEWCLRQPQKLRECIEAYNNDPGPETIPKAIPCREGLAEYLAYRHASGGLVIGSLAYLLHLKTSTSSGWANCAIPGQSGSSSIAIPVSGIERGSGESLEIELQFCQAPRTVAIAAGIEQEIRGFNYTITFRRAHNSQYFVADFYHPDYPDEPRLLVGKSQLTPRA